VAINRVRRPAFRFDLSQNQSVGLLSHDTGADLISPCFSSRGALEDPLATLPYLRYMSIVAPKYAAVRSQLAKQMGLGQQRRRDSH
jgi:hypothetical protein